MPIEQINLREKLDEVRQSFDTQLAEILRRRSDISHAEVRDKFGVSDKDIRRVTRQFKIARKRGPKPTR
jgi:hypothetical protein